MHSVTVDVLGQEMYTEQEAARLLRVQRGTLHYWLEGGDRRGVTYKPVVRPEPTGRNAVTWAEFVEAGWLREYRRTHQIPMRELRAFIEKLRERFDIPFPLAHAQPLVSGKQLVREVQTETNLDADFCLVAEANGQLLLTAPGASFVKRVEFDEHGQAARWRPHSDERSTVRIDPTVRFGRPSVGGVSTAVLWEEYEAGAGESELAETFALPRADVTWALAYESTARAS